MEVKVEVNTINVVNELKRMSSKQKKAVKKALNKVSNMERNKIASYHDIFGAGKGKVVRPFFAIGNKEEDQIRQEFTSTYFKEMKI